MIIFEGEELLLHFHEAASDYIIISFASADQTEHAYDRYFLQPIAEKYHLSCLGITTKIDNFYQHSDMHHIIPLCNEITQHYKKIIIIGLSMGAYAALKFSAALHANIVFAMGARYTLDVMVAPVCGIMQRTIDRLDPYSIQETTIFPHEVSGKLYIAHDIYKGILGYNDIDHRHANKIMENLPNSVLVPVPFAHHLVVNSLKGSEEFKSILDMLVTEEDHLVIAQVAKIRRYHIHNIYSKILILKDRYPLLVYKLLLSKSLSQVKNNHIVYDDNERNLTLIYQLFIRGYVKESRSLLRSCLLRGLLQCSLYEANQMNENAGHGFRLLSDQLDYLVAHSGYLLVFDAVQKKITTTRFLKGESHQLPLRIYNNQLVCLWKEMVFSLKYMGSEIALMPLHSEVQANNVLSIEQQDQTAIIYTPEHKFCFRVDLDGNGDFYRIEPREWEKFAIV
ncbi:hypothetical protein [Commensalibacter nepenthis]|uniref:Alpha/beta hydrolase n=1 Tax=Commensalibacter nepenthis TaxID=3043872 RepID=A0ABT6Q5K7_9PROT|nr:hypothetical protein [Commensalibacter sp. TBRC 10068]MDI2112179.1 hypothetical protein [Commensalibacter sp. TBRC 10068]